MSRTDRDVGKGGGDGVDGSDDERSARERELDFMMAQGRLPGAEKDRIFRNVLSATRDASSAPIAQSDRAQESEFESTWYARLATFWRMPTLRWLVPVTAVLVLAVPSLIIQMRVRNASSPITGIAAPADTDGQFTARGEDDVASQGRAGGADLAVGCQDVCRQGSTLLFRVQALHEPGLFAAFAEDSGGQRVWYFPSPDGELPAVAAAREPSVLPRGVRIGTEQSPGRVDVHMWVLRRALGRTEIVRLREMQGRGALPGQAPGQTPDELELAKDVLAYRMQRLDILAK